ncbi:MAG: pyrimidine 5'-nucleotidase [Boseongicola sp. SB0662_bin_57]|nr:pyrimidine 5'-nucleotidase [Boseongicola sp. SB0662_bin_57]
MTTSKFSDVDTWIFDLDNTLYPPEARLFEQIELRMTEWVVDALGVDRAAANEIRRRYWVRFGTTLAGLMREHDIDPEAYLDHVHDICLDHLEPDPGLANAIAALPGRAIVHTNGSGPYARRVIEARGLSGIFDAVYGIEHAGFLPKPERLAFETIIARDGLVPERAAMFEDDARNLVAPMALGMRTILVARASSAAPHVQHHAPDLAEFLRSLP